MPAPLGSHPADPASTRPDRDSPSWTERLLSERWRSGLALIGCLVVAAGLVVTNRLSDRFSGVDSAVLVLLAYLGVYFVLTARIFGRAHHHQVRRWAERDNRGTFVQRYLLGTAPGPGVSIFIALSSLAITVWWLPSGEGSALALPARIGIAVVLVPLAWITVTSSFAVTFWADNLLEDLKGLDFPDDQVPRWSDYGYFALSVMTTFGTTDVTVTSRAMRRTVAVNSTIAFVFNTVTVATLVSVLSS